MRTLKEYWSKNFYKLSPLNSPLSTRKGFTIIELLVVLTLVGLVSGIGIFSLVSYSNTQTIEQTVGNIKAIFDEAKFNSISSVKFETDKLGNQVNCTDDLVAYMVDVIPSAGDESDAVSLFMICESASTLIKTYNFPQNIALDIGTSCDTVTYEALHVNASGTPLLPCEIIISGFNQTRTITIDSLGNVSLNN